MTEKTANTFPNPMYQPSKRISVQRKIFPLVDEHKLLKMDLQGISGISGGDEVRGLPLCYEGLELKEEERAQL